MASPKSIGVIGAGNIVFNAHLPVLKAMGCELRWILDASKTRAEEVADAFGIPAALDATELNRCPQTDIVLLACPYGSRKPYYEFLRERADAIYIEKPVARTVRELKEICRLRPDYGIAAGFYRRSMGSMNIVRRLIEDGVFGRLRRVRSEFGTATVISSGGGFAKDAVLAGGGQLIESAIHNVDAICYMAGITEATVGRCKMEQEKGFDLQTEADLTLVSGSGCEIEMSLLVTCFYTTQYEIEMEFDNAILNFSLFRKTIPTIRAVGSERSYQIVDSLLIDYPRDAYDAMQLFWTDFLAGLDSLQSNYTNACATIVTTSIIEQLYRIGIVPPQSENSDETGSIVYGAAG